jgi:C1A family cysteine protease
MGKIVKIERKFGWKRDQPDFRDKVLPLVKRTLPESVDLRSKCPPIIDQLDLGSCTANAIASAYQYVHMKQGLGNFVPSRLFIYYNERVMEDSVSEDAGALIRDGLKSIGNGSQGKGVCSETLWPYKTYKFARKPCVKCYTNALKDQAIKYMGVPQSADHLKSCLADGYPFVFGFTVYSSFMNIGDNGLAAMPEVTDTVEGGHAVICVGYDESKQLYIIRNSWGESWGDKGYFYMPYKYLHDPNLSDDFWVIQLVK